MKNRIQTDLTIGKRYIQPHPFFQESENDFKNDSISYSSIEKSYIEKKKKNQNGQPNPKILRNDSIFYSSVEKKSFIKESFIKENKNGQ